MFFIVWALKCVFDVDVVIRAVLFFFLSFDVAQQSSLTLILFY